MDNICYLSVGKKFDNSVTNMPLNRQIRKQGCIRNNIAIISMDENCNEWRIIAYRCYRFLEKDKEI